MSLHLCLRDVFSWLEWSYNFWRKITEAKRHPQYTDTKGVYTLSVWLPFDDLNFEDQAGVPVAWLLHSKVTILPFSLFMLCFLEKS